MRDYRVVGDVVPFGEAYVGAEEVMPIRELAEIDLFLCARVARIDAGETVDRAKFTLLYQTHDADFDGTSQHLSVATSQERELNMWHLLISMRRYRMSDRHSNKFTHYRFDGLGEDVLQAKKQVYVLRGRSEIVIDPLEGPQEVISNRRLMFEKALQPDDCTQLLGLLSRGIRRAKAA